VNDPDVDKIAFISVTTRARSCNGCTERLIDSAVEERVRGTAAVPDLRRAPLAISRSVLPSSPATWGGRRAKRDTCGAFKRVWWTPQMHRVEVLRPSLGLEFRRHYEAQFVIVYAYIGPSPKYPSGVVGK